MKSVRSAACARTGFVRTHHCARPQQRSAPIKSSSGVVTIPLMDDAVRLPRGKRLVVELGATSADDLYHLGVPIYASAAPASASIVVRSETLKLSFLERTVSK